MRIYLAAIVVLVGAVLVDGEPVAAQDALWNIGDRGLFDRTDKAYSIQNGRVRVDTECLTFPGTSKRWRTTSSPRLML
jgi:hypothetical protein